MERLFYIIYNADTGGNLMEITKTTNKTNIQKLADYINGQPNPELFAATLFAFAKPRFHDLADSKKELQIRIG